MPLLDYLSADEDDQRSEIEEFLSSRWTGVMDEEPVLNAQKSGESSSWFCREFLVREHKVEGQGRIETAFSFKAIGHNGNDRQTGEVIRGTAKAWIDENDNVEFSDIEAELTAPDR